MKSLIFILVSVILFTVFFRFFDFSQFQSTSSLELRHAPETVTTARIKKNVDFVTTTTKSVTTTTSPKIINKPTSLHFQSNTKQKNNQKFTLLNDRPELGFKYHKNANLINPHSRYAVIIANRLSSKSKITYVFQIPFACLTWIQIGYGCFIVMPHFTDLELENKQLKKANNLIQDFIAKQNFRKNSKSTENVNAKVVILNMKSSQQDKIIMLAQVTRLFISQIVKYSVTENDFKNLQNIYFMTTDVDLYPLSARKYYDEIHDWALVNIINYGRQNLYVALSCIGARIEIWEKLVSESDYEVEFFNSTGLFSMMEKEAEIRLEKNPKLSHATAGKPGHTDIDWYMDQLLVSDWLIRYCDKFGWDKIQKNLKKCSIFKKFKLNKNFFSIFFNFSLSSGRSNYNSGRVDKIHIRNHRWDQIVDLSALTPYKDVHACTSPHENICFWKLHRILAFILPAEELRDLVSLREAFVDLILSDSNTEVADGRSIKELKRNKDNQNILKQEINEYKNEKNITENLNLNIFSRWTHMYPRTFLESHPYGKPGEIYKPVVVDWSKERVFMVPVDKIVGASEARYFVIPSYGSVNMNDFASENFRKRFCQNCVEIFLN